MALDMMQSLVAAKTLTNINGHPISLSLGRIGSLEVRLTRDDEEVWQCQRLRHCVFLEARGLSHLSDVFKEPIDQDKYDAFCDHMIVVDHDTGGQIIGTYRLLGQEESIATGGFYSSAYFETERLVQRKPSKRFLELGRSCVLPEYRTKRTVELLWQGIWNYCKQRRFDVLIGSASLASPIPENHATELSFLNYYCLAGADWAVSARPLRFQSMRLMPEISIDTRLAFSLLPPLLKGYLRVGAKVGNGCVIDPELGTTVIMIVLPMECIAARYAQHFGADKRRMAL